MTDEPLRKSYDRLMAIRAAGDAGRADCLPPEDLQQVTTNVAINYHLDPLKVAHVYQTIGTFDQVGQRIILPAVSGSST